MEHRRDHRKLLSSEIKIIDRNHGEIEGKIRNISLSGMLVDIGDDQHQLNPIVNVTFPVANCGGQKHCQAKAFIVHQQSGCLGLMFSELDADVRQMLRKMLYGYATVAERAYLYHGYSDTTHNLPKQVNAY
ncbi:MAG: PilZ domain-containing protein [Candidatus Thiodiazotropha sp.]